MSKKDKRIDDYIQKAAPFAQPILNHIRQLVHETCPGVEETLKWRFPHFDLNGKTLLSMAAFKQHAVFAFWKAALLNDPGNYLQARKAQGGEAMGHGGRLTSVKDLPPDKTFKDFLKQAAALNMNDVKPPRAPKKTIGPQDIEAPADFEKALKTNKAAWTTWQAWTDGKKKEYVVWVTGAKTEETRSKRIVTSVEWIAEGKIRNWKYVK